MGGALKKIAPSRGRRENIWGISFEKSRFYAKKSYFSNFRGGAQNFWGISCEKSRFYAKKIIFLPILGGGGASGAPPPESAPAILIQGTNNILKGVTEVGDNLQCALLFSYFCFFVCFLIYHL